jgi:small-conductance mechanosensitive channel
VGSLDFLNEPIVKIGTSNFSLQKILILIFILILFFLFAKMLQKLVVNQIVRKSPKQKESVLTIAKFIYYFVVFVGFLVILQANGIDLTALTLLTSALGIGIGFGLQAITNNLISGILILFERPIKIGDRIEVGEISGNIVAISLRATTITTNDNISVIIPNSEFITSRVTNWTLNDRNVRFNFKVGVAYSSDPQIVKRLLIKVAEENTGVLKSPAPDVLLDSFGDSSINFLLRVWTNDYSSKPNVLKSELYYEIYETFKNNKIEIPFPQLDLHFKSKEALTQPHS